MGRYAPARGQSRGRKIVVTNSPMPIAPGVQLGKLLVILGAVIAAAGIALIAGGRLHLPVLGRLPGDIVHRGKHSSIYFPIVTCLIISAAITLILWFASTLGKR